MLERDEASQRLALVLGWARGLAVETESSSSREKCSKNAARTHRQLHELLGCVFCCEDDADHLAKRVLPMPPH